MTRKVRSQPSADRGRCKEVPRPKMPEPDDFTVVYDGKDMYLAADGVKIGRFGMRRATLAASAALITLGATCSLADRSLALPLLDPRVHDLAIAGSPIQKAWCRRWWQWHGARWVRSCWPAGYDPCGYARGCAPPTWHHPYWRPWGEPPPYRYWFY